MTMMHHLIRGAIILASCACVAESFGILIGAKRCTSKPSNWSDQWGTCGTYKTKNWCTKAGKLGKGWKAEWGTVSPSALKACCECGGGKKSRKDNKGGTKKPTGNRSLANTPTFTAFRIATSTGLAQDTGEMKDTGDNWTVHNFDMYETPDCRGPKVAVKSGSAISSTTTAQTTCGFDGSLRCEAGNVFHPLNKTTQALWQANCSQCKEDEAWIGFEPASAAHPRCMKVMQCNVNGCAPFIKLQARTEAGSWVTLLGHIQMPDPGKWAVIRTPLKPAKAGQGVSKPIKQYYDHHAGVKWCCSDTPQKGFGKSTCNGTDVWVESVPKGKKRKAVCHSRSWTNEYRRCKGLGGRLCHHTEQGDSCKDGTQCTHKLSHKPSATTTTTKAPTTTPGSS